MLPADTLENRLVHLAQSPRLRAQTYGMAAYGNAHFPLQAFAWGDAALPAIFLLAGVHGDEPGGIEAALHLLETLADGVVPLTRYHLLVLPCLNPSGLADGTRANRIGQDINRQFHSDVTQETAAVRRFLRLPGAAALVDLHCDRQVQGYYLFELRREGVSSLADPILQGVTEAGFPLEERPFYAGYLGRRGLFAPTTAELEEYHRTAAGRSAAEWGWSNAVAHSYSMEAPSGGGYERSAAMHSAALSALFAALEGERSTEG